MKSNKTKKGQHQFTPKKNIPSSKSHPASRPSEEQKRSSYIFKLGCIIAVVGFLIYSQSLKYDFTYDDSISITDNAITTKGVKSLGTIFTTVFYSGSAATDVSLYRPVPKAVFAVCWSVSSGNPFFFHLVNVLVYALTGLILFLTLVKFFPKNIFIPFITSLLFITHPIHTEVVDNCKSLDEF